MVLNAMREGAKSGFAKFVLMGIMTLAVGGLVLLDVGGFFRGGVPITAVAKVDGQELQSSQFDITVRRALSRQGLDTETAYRLGYINQILNNEISRNILARAARDIGLEISDELLAKQVKAFLEPYTASGLSSKEALERLLFNQGMGEAEFVHTLKSESSTSMLRNAVQNGAAFISDQEARDIYQYQNEERKIKTVILSNSSVKDYKEPTDEVLLPFYQIAKEKYAVPETRSFTMAVLRSKDLEGTLDVTEEELRQIYEEEIEGFKLPERRSLEQAVLENQSDALKVINNLEKDKSLKEAVELATGSADAYLGTDSFRQDGLVEEIGVEAFAASKGDVIGPIDTALGTHILILKDIEKPEVQSFESVKDQLQQEITQIKLADQLFNMSGVIDDQLASGSTLEETAQELNLKIYTLGPIRRDGSTPDNKDGMKGFEDDLQYLTEYVYEMLEAETSPVVELSDGSYASIRLDTVTPKNYKPFDDVKKDLKDVWVKDQQEVLNKMRAQESLMSLGAGESTLSKIASKYGTSVKSFTVKRNEGAEGPITPAAKTKIFEQTVDNYTVAMLPDGYLIAYIESIEIPDADKIKKDDLEPVKDIAKRGTQDEYFINYINSLQDRYKVKVNQKALEAMYAPSQEEF